MTSKDYSALGIIMKDLVATMKAEGSFIFIFPDRVELKHTGFVSRNMSGVVLPFSEIAHLSFEEPTTHIDAGRLRFEMYGEEERPKPGFFKAFTDERTICFRKKHLAEITAIHDLILQALKNPDKRIEAPNAQKQAFEAKVAPPPPVEPRCPTKPDDFNLYRNLTQDQDWQRINGVNGCEREQLGTAKEFKVLSNYLRKDETVFAFVSGVMEQTSTSNAWDFGTNTWLAVLTDSRILLLDHAFMSKSVDTQSIMHSKIQALSGSQGWTLGKIMIDIGNRAIVIDNCPKKDVEVFARIANAWLEHLNKKSSTQPTVASKDNIQKIRELAELRDAGILSEEEFAAKKTQLLNDI